MSGSAPEPAPAHDPAPGGSRTVHGEHRHVGHPHGEHTEHRQIEHGHIEHENTEHRNAEHRHAEHRHGPATWRTAASATLHCLTGCAIGEVLGMVIGTALSWSNAATLILSVALAFLFGYALTLRGLLRADVGWRQAVRLAIAADTLSILIMEIVDNGFIVVVPGAMDAGLATGLFWGALAASLALAFVVTTPVNKWIIGKGRGHAVVHAYH
ncbi:hypothetical protein Psi02_66340 [Planotetraspora silvatica]|uniref:DUF4396 domain-containing protein n=1 Tax=Planotetraspora silvatica TaxID=234614 RepID=A0A8J3XRH5_9ACTN|nr:DUF4396 domain-containing protein [Planotetraspora silvatica]GII50210.1 hypothetical protein Psi02_66340 [Planotetraspora silvatica]